MSETWDLVVIGAGPAGSRAARAASATSSSVASGFAIRMLFARVSWNK